VNEEFRFYSSRDKDCVFVMFVSEGSLYFANAKEWILYSSRADYLFFLHLKDNRDVGWQRTVGILDS